MSENLWDLTGKQKTQHKLALQTYIHDNFVQLHETVQKCS